MKKLKFFRILLVSIISSFFLINEVAAYLTATTDSKVNTFTIENEVNYVVYHKLMDLNGETYTIDEAATVSGRVTRGTVVTPQVNSYVGFKTPEQQTVVVDSFNTVVITYLYEREKYVLTIENSDNVTTSTPSGEYYYGTPITLVADNFDEHNTPFEKWSNEDTDQSISFTMPAENVTIGPLYGSPYIVSFVTNTGAVVPSIERYPGEMIGEFPAVTNDDCQLSEGSYDERNCTYAYAIQGWYKDANFQNQVDESFVPTEDITLYAKWTKIYYHDDEEEFTGNNFLDSEIALFSKENANKNFIVKFTLDRNDSAGVAQATLFGDINEKADPWPGTVIRYDKNHFEFVANVTSGTGMGKRKKQTISGYDVGQTYVIKRDNGKLYYSVDGGANYILFNDFTEFNRYFDVTGTFGAEYNENGNPYRYFRGKLSDMTVELSERDSYIVKFNANGGTGTMINQKIVIGDSTALKQNTYIRQGYVFTGWNTEPDGSGDSYNDGEEVTNLANKDETITLYAQWEEASYFVAFDANGGTGSMENQEFIFGLEQPLNPSQFSKEGYIFDSWNTEPDGSGTRYEEGESVMNLTNVPSGVVTLYAQYGKREYHYAGEITFDGVDDYIDTEVNLYSGVNIDKDFDISFDLIYADPINANVYQPTILNAKDESHIISGTTNMVPGFVVRFNGKYSPIDIKGRWGSKDSSDTVATANTPIHFEFHRRNGVVTSTYSYNDGANTHTITLYNQNDWTLESNCGSTVTIGAIVKNGVPDRFFTGTLADIDIVVYD